MSSNRDIDALIDMMAKLPGLGPRSARRAVLHMIRKKTLVLHPLTELLQAVALNVRECVNCGNLGSGAVCDIYVKLLVEIETTLRLAAYQPGRIEFVPTERAPADLAQRLGQKLQQWTGNRWAVTIVNEGGAETIAEVRDAKVRALKAQAAEHPMVRAVLAAFPKASIHAVRTPEEIAAEAEAEALPEVEDEWDPFEEE